MNRLPSHLGVRQHELAQQRQLGPEPGHGGVQVRHVVEDGDVVQSAVIDFVLETLEQDVVAHGVVARLGLRSRHQKNAVRAAAVLPHVWVLLQPQRALRVPVGDRRAQRVWIAYLWIIVLLLVRGAEDAARLMT